MHHVWSSGMSLSGRRGRVTRHYSEISHLKIDISRNEKLFHIWCGRKLDELVAGGWGSLGLLRPIIRSPSRQVPTRGRHPGWLLT